VLLLLLYIIKNLKKLLTIINLTFKWHPTCNNDVWHRVGFVFNFSLVYNKWIPCCHAFVQLDHRKHQSVVQTEVLDILVSSFLILTTFWHQQQSVNEQIQGTMKSICPSHILKVFSECYLYISTVVFQNLCVECFWDLK